MTIPRFSTLLLLVALAAPALWASPKEVLFLIGEREYGTKESLPKFAEKWLDDSKYTSSFIAAQSDDRNAKTCHNFPGLAPALARADVLVISTRRRYPAQENLAAIQAWIKQGKPVIGLRTASHAFGERSKGKGYQAPAGHAAWNTFDQEVFGARYTGHYPPKSAGFLHILTANDPSRLLRDAPREPQRIRSHLYTFVDVDPSITPLVEGQIEGKPTREPVAWRYAKNGVNSYYLSLGSVEDFAQPLTNLILRNMIRAAAR